MSGLFNKPKMPEIPAALPMPDPADPAAVAARKKALTRETGMGGVQSTILSTGGRETLGG